MTHSRGEPARLPRSSGDPRAETLTIKVFRCATAGFSSGETDCWNVGFQALGAAVSPDEAGPLFGEFYGFARALVATSRRPLSFWPLTCRGLCGDEALALLMIEQAQRANPTGVLAAAAALLGADELGDALQATQSLATSLARRGLFLCAPAPAEACGFDLCPMRRLN